MAKANPALIAETLRDIAEKLSGDKELARGVATALGMDISAFAIAIDGPSLRRLVDRSVADALDKRELRVGEISTEAARKVLAESEAKLERIATQVHEAHVAPQVKRLRDDAVDATDRVNKSHASGQRRIEELTERMVRALSDLEAVKKQAEADRDVASAAAQQLNLLIARANEAVAAIEAKALAAAAPAPIPQTPKP